MNFDYLDTDTPLHVVYHADCTDGTASAWAVKQRFGHKDNITYQNLQYGYKPEELDKIPKDANVLVVDFSFTKEDTLALASVLPSLTVLDHHKTAQGYLQGLIDDGTIRGVFDMTKGGALVTWDALHDAPAPELIQYVSDRDLFQFKLENTRPVVEALLAFSGGKDLETLEGILDKYSIDELCTLGHAALAYKQECLKSLMHNTFWVEREGKKVPVNNATRVFASDLAVPLYADPEVPFVAMVSVSGSGHGLSLRSHKVHGIDISPIAQSFGGGGHRNAGGGILPKISDLGEPTDGTVYPEYRFDHAGGGEPVIDAFRKNGAEVLVRSAFIRRNTDGTVTPIVNTPEMLEPVVLEQLKDRYGVDLCTSELAPVSTIGTVRMNNKGEYEVRDFAIDGIAPALISVTKLSSLEDGEGEILSYDDSSAWRKAHKELVKQMEGNSFDSKLDVATGIVEAQSEPTVVRSVGVTGQKLGM